MTATSEISTGSSPRSLPDGPRPFALDEADKRYLLRACRIALENAFERRRVAADDFGGVPYNIATQDPKIFVTVYREGRAAGCRSAQAGDMLTSSLDATRKAVRDDRLTGRLKRRDLPLAYIDITVLLDGEVVDQTQDDFDRHIELGVDSVSIERGPQTAFFKSSVPIKKNYSIRKTLRRLSRKAGLEPEAYLNPDVTLRRYTTIQFAEDFVDRFTEPGLVSLYRGAPIVELAEVNRASLEGALRLASGFFQRHVTPKGRLTYEFQPDSGERRYSKAGVAVLRRSASTWMMAETARFLREEALLRAAKRSTDYLLEQHYRSDAGGGFAYLLTKDTAHVGTAAFMLLTLVAIDDPAYSPMVDGLADFILAMEDREGGFLSPSYLPEKSDATDSKHHYYPGEAMTALMKLHSVTGDRRYADLVARVFPFYRAFYRSTEKRINMAAWMSKPYAALFETTRDPEHAEFVFEINDMVVDRQYGLDSPYLDKVGGFSRKGDSPSAGVFLESIAEGLRTARQVNDEQRINRYSEALTLGMRFVLQAQYKPGELRQHPHRERTLGGVRTSFFDPSVRIDSVQHGVCAILNTLEHGALSY